MLVMVSGPVSAESDKMRMDNTDKTQQGGGRGLENADTFR